MDQEIRSTLRNVVTECRKLLEDSVSQELEGKFCIFAKKDQVTADPNAKMTHLTEEERTARKDILDHFGHIKARGFKPKEALDQLVREIAFTHLNRLCAYKMMEVRGVYVGGQKCREAVSRGFKSNGFLFYLGTEGHEADERLYGTGQQELAYRHFLDWLGGLLSDEIGVLFNPNDPANRLYPRQRTLDEVLDLLNSGGIKAEETELREAWPEIWSQDETIGWVYQYFTPKELRDQARKESAAPRNSYELAFRNQFFTPRYVVEFLTDNTLGRIWYEMRKGNTKLKDECRYLVRRPTEVFLKGGEKLLKESAEVRDDLSQEELLKLPVYIPHRPKKDPRDLKILDPACGSAHFLLYCFDLLLTIYEEAYADPDLGPALQKDYPKLEDLQRDAPRLILAHNLHGIDIDLRATQIAALALWLRCQRAYQQMGLKRERPNITRSNIVCAEPMPGEEQMLNEFVGQLEPRLLGQVVEVVFDKMKLAGEAGSLLKIEEEIRDAVAAAKKQWVREITQAKDRKGQPLLFTQAALDRIAGKPEQASLFDLSDITDDQFFEQAEGKVIEALRQYGEKAQNGHPLQQRLFSDDAEQGFAFVNLCSQRYDVVLMNPPFGSYSSGTRAYATATYPDCQEDVDAGFIKRGVSVLGTGGSLGAIVNRTQFFKSTLRHWRESTLLGGAMLYEGADLGLGVLDGAMVEAVIYVIRTAPVALQPSLFFRLLESQQRDRDLAEAVASMSDAIGSSLIHALPLKEFHSIPESRISYSASKSFRLAFRRMTLFGQGWGKARQGSITSDNFRFLRLSWEVPAAAIGRSLEDTTERDKRWVLFAKGGEYSPYFQDLHLLVEWAQNGEEIRNFVDGDGALKSRPQNLEYNFLPALTYSERTASGFSPRWCPPGCVYSQVGPILSLNDTQQLLSTLAILMSRVAASFIEMMTESADAITSIGAARHYTQGLIESIPLPELTPEERAFLDLRIKAIWASLRDLDSTDEVSRYFCDPVMVSPLCKVRSLQDLAALAERYREAQCAKIVTLSWEMENCIRRLYGIDAQAGTDISRTLGPHPEQYSSTPLIPSERTELQRLYFLSTEDLIQEEIAGSGASRAITKKYYVADRELELISARLKKNPSSVVDALSDMGLVRPRDALASANAIASFCLGCVFGRWDVRYSIGTAAPPTPIEMSEPIPPCSPGMLQGGDHLPLTEVPADYPLSIDRDGILVDDPEHQGDIVRRVRHALEIAWNGRAEAIEKELCDILGVREVRDYFRKSGKGGFWDVHVSRYSKSHRKAPIYWILQSSKRNYALWLYYHRLNKDLLFKALVNYVEPKSRMEASHLGTLRNQKATAGDSGKEAKRLAKEVERQEDFLSELQDFEDKLRRAANLHLEPDLNDGAVLNIAPLHELVPWKEAKNYWEELLEGRYEWSCIGKQLRRKGLVK